MVEGAGRILRRTKLKFACFIVLPAFNPHRGISEARAIIWETEEGAGFIANVIKFQKI